MFGGLNLSVTLPSSITDVAGITRFFFGVLDISWNRLLVETGKVIGAGKVALLVRVTNWISPLADMDWNGISNLITNRPWR